MACNSDIGSLMAVENDDICLDDLEEGNDQDGKGKLLWFFKYSETLLLKVVKVLPSGSEFSWPLPILFETDSYLCSDHNQILPQILLNLGSLYSPLQAFFGLWKAHRLLGICHW